jgi:hypothetical protein
MQKKILIVGLDELSENIINKITKEYEIFGCDFDLNKVNTFYRNNLIKNDSSVNANIFFKETDFIILNVSFLNYGKIYKFLSLIKDDCLIIDTNSYKGNISSIKTIFNDKFKKFLPCNFLLFPDNIIINIGNDSNMQLVKNAYTFFKSIEICTMSLTHEENELIFTEIYHVPFLLQEMLFRSSSFFFFEKDKIFLQKIVDDILLNNKNIINTCLKISNELEKLKNKELIIQLIKNNNLIKKNVSLDVEIDTDMSIKILLEKILISFAKENNYIGYIDTLQINFNYKIYDEEKIIQYFAKLNDFDILILILKEKIRNLISILSFADINVDKFLKFLRNF